MRKVSCELASATRFVAFANLTIHPHVTFDNLPPAVTCYMHIRTMTVPKTYSTTYAQLDAVTN